MTGDDLESRERLPDALRVLLARHPREGWQTDVPLGGLTDFWLKRHLMFRQLLEELKERTELLTDRRIAPEEYGPQLSRYGGFFVSQLHEHHHVEDAHYFPLLVKTEQRLAHGFDLLDRDHVALDGHLKGFVTDANAVLQSLSEPGADAGEAQRFLDGLKRLERFLDRHLTDEEDLVVPILLEHGEGGLG